MGISREYTIEPGIASQFWELYDEAFRSTRLASPCRQYLREEEFMEEMQDERIIKFILRDREQAVAMAIVAESLDAVPWISPEYFAGLFPQEYVEHRIFYFEALLTAPHSQRHGNSAQLLAAMINFIGERNGIACFDCSDVNDQFLPELIKSEGEKQLRFEPRKLGMQHYYAFCSAGFKPGFAPGQFNGDVAVLTPSP